MKHSKYLITLCFPLLLIGTNNAQATNILAIPSILPLEEKGLAWDHPSSTVTGVGELKFEDKGANIPVEVKYEGTISCTVSVSAAGNYQNKLEIKPEDFGNEVETKSKVGSINISDCTVNGEPIAETTALSSSKVEVEIEGYYENVSGVMVFSEYEAEGKTLHNGEKKAKLELKDGTILTTPPACGSSSCGGGFIIPPNGI